MFRRTVLTALASGTGASVGGCLSGRGRSSSTASAPSPSTSPSPTTVDRPAIEHVRDGDAPANGVWVWYADRIPAYERCIDGSVRVAGLGHGSPAWKNVAPFEIRDFPEWVGASDDRIFMPHVPMLPATAVDRHGRGTALRKLAAGDFDDRFRHMAHSFADAGYDPSTLLLRLGNAFNLQKQPYSPLGSDVGPETWIAGYRRIVEVTREVVGAGLMTVWAPELGRGTMGPERALAHFPGAAYAHAGGGLYDVGRAYGDPAAAPAEIDYRSASDAERERVQAHVWEHHHREGRTAEGQRVGLDHVVRVAEGTGARVVLPKWALTGAGYRYGGGDNPVFVRRLADWIVTHDVPLHLYFEWDAGRDHMLCGGDADFGTAARVFRERFGEEARAP